MRQRRFLRSERFIHARNLIPLILLSIILLSHIGFVKGDPKPPVADFMYSPDYPVPNEAIMFNASSSYDTDGSILRYTWNFGDGNVTTMTTPAITHSYPVDGSYTVELTVTDNDSLVGVSVAVVQVSTVVFFRVVILGVLVPLSDVEVTIYYNNGSAWTQAPAGPHGFQIMYDRMTQPHLASTSEEKYRNPGYTASILRCDASNIGFDLGPATWTVFFKFKWGSFVAYWPNSTSRVYTYDKGEVETHDYKSGHQAYWDPTASAYVIKVADIPRSGVSPSESHPMIAGFLSPAAQKSYLTVKTDPGSLTTIPGEGWYIKDTSVGLTAPGYVNISSTSRYRFAYWDVDGTSCGVGVNPITVLMTANHTATAHYIQQYFLAVSSPHGASGGQGWYDSGSTAYATVAPLTVPGPSGILYVFTSWSGDASGTTSPSNPIAMNGPKTATAVWHIQSPIPGFSLTIWTEPVNITGIPGGGLYADGTSVGLIAPGYVNISSTSRYRFAYWDVDGSSSGIGVNPITVLMTANHTATAHYIPQYYLALTTSPQDVISPLGEGWFDPGTNATISTIAFLDIVPDSSRYRFNGWTATDMTEIADPTRSPTTVLMDEAKTVTANYVTQYRVTFNYSGVDSDFTGRIVTVDFANYTRSLLSYDFWWDNDSSHTFVFQSPLTVTANAKQYAWTNTTGLSTLQSGSITASASGNVIGNYKTQYYLTITPAFGGTTTPVTGIYVYDAGTVVNVKATANVDSFFASWLLDGSNGGTANPASITMSADHTLKAIFVYPPTASFTESPIIPYINQIVTFNASASKPGFDGDSNRPITEYRWDFNGDDTIDLTTSNPIATYNFTNAGFYLVKLTVYAPPSLQGSPQYVSYGDSMHLKWVLMPVGGQLFQSEGSGSLSLSPFDLSWSYIAFLLIAMTLSLALMKRLRKPGSSFRR